MREFEHKGRTIRYREVLSPEVKLPIVAVYEVRYGGGHFTGKVVKIVVGAEGKGVRWVAHVNVTGALFARRKTLKEAAIDLVERCAPYGQTGLRSEGEI